MNKIRLILMNGSKVDYDFNLEMETPKKGGLITIPTIDDDYINYKVEFIQYFIERYGEFRNITVTAVKI